MKNINIKFVLLILIGVLIISCGDDDKSTTEPEIEIDQALVGTWDLTKISIVSGTITIDLTPEQAGIAFIAVFNSDGTFESTSTDSDGPTVDTGTWGASEGVLTITIEGDDPIISPYAVNGNVVTIEEYSVPIPNLGNIPAALEFTKR